MALLKDLTVFGASRFVSDVFGDNIYANKHIKNGSSDSYVLLGGGGHKLISDFSTSAHNHTLNIATDSGTNQLTLAYNTKYKLTAGGSTFIFTMPTANFASSSHEHNRIILTDDRSKYPAQITGNATKAIFGSFMNNSTIGINTTTYGSYSDALVIRGYGDSSGGKENAIIFNKNSNNVWHSQFDFGSTTSWGTSYLFCDTGNSSVSGGGSTWGSSITVNIAGTSKTLTIPSNPNTHNSHIIYSGKKSDGTTDIASTSSSTNITLGASGVTAGVYGDSGNQTPGYNATFKVPYIRVNAQGIVTELSEHTVKIPASDNSDTKVTQTITSSSNTDSRPLLIGYSSSANNPPSFSTVTNTSYATHNMYVDPSIGRLNLNTLNNIITGTGTAAQDSGSGNNRYKPAKWTFNKGIIPKDGDIYTIKIPVAGHDYGVFVSLNNGTNYYPVVLNGTDRLTNHFPVNSYLLIAYESSGQTNSVFPSEGGTSRTNIVGSFRVLNYRDTNTDVRYQQSIYYNRRKVIIGGAIRKYTLCMMNYEGKITSLTLTNNSIATTKTMYTGYLDWRKVYYWNTTTTYESGVDTNADNVLLTHNGDLIDYRYTFNCGTTLTPRNSFYIVGTVDNNGFKLDATKPWSDTLPTSEDGKIYIYVGMIYIDASGYRGTLEEVNTAYWYKNGAIRKYEDYPPIQTKLYDGTTFYGPDTWNDTSRFFFKVKPQALNKYWRIKYRIRTWIPTSETYTTTSIIEYFGHGISMNTYKIWNTIKTGYAPYYHVAFWLKEAGFNAGCGHLIGESIRYGTNSNNSSWYRYMQVDLLEYDGCSVEMLDNAVKFSTITEYGSTSTGGPATTNYNGISAYNATAQGLQETGDNDTITQAYDAKAYKVGDTAIPAYNPIGENTDGLLVPMLSKPFVIDGPMYLNSSQMNANATGSWAGLYYNHYNYQIRNGSNYVDGVIYKPLYLKGTISGILFTVDSTTPYVTALPTTDDGKYYYYLGEITASTASSKYTYLSYRTGNHPIFFYKNNKLNIYGSEITAASLGTSGNNTTLSVTVGGVTKTGSVTVPYATNASTATNSNSVYIRNNTSQDLNYPLLWTDSRNTNEGYQNVYKSYDYLLYNPSAKNLTTTSLNNIRIKYSVINDSTSFATNFVTDVFGVNNSNWAKFAVTRFNVNGPISIMPSGASYSSGIAWEGADTFGGMSFGYYTPLIKFFGGNNSGNSGNPVWYFELLGNHGTTYNLSLLNWIQLCESNFSVSSTPQHTKWFRISIVNTTAGDNIENDWMIEIYSYSDQNYASFYHGYLRLTAYGTGSTSIVLSSSPNAIFNDTDAPHVYATIDSSRQIWIGVRALYTCRTKFRVIQEGSYNTIIKSAWQEQTTPPNNTYIIDNGKLHNYNGNVEPLTLDNVVAIYKTKASSNLESSHWSKFGIKDYENMLPDGLNSVNSQICNKGGVLSIAGYNSRLDIYFSDRSTDQSTESVYAQRGIYVRSGWNNDKRNWERLYTGGQDLIPDSDNKYNIGYMPIGNTNHPCDTFGLVKRYKTINARNLNCFFKHNEMSPRHLFDTKVRDSNNNYNDYTINVDSSYTISNGGPDSDEKTIWNNNLGCMFSVGSKFERRIHTYRTKYAEQTSNSWSGGLATKRYYYHRIFNILEPIVNNNHFGDGGDYFEFGAVSTTTNLSPNTGNTPQLDNNATFYSTMNSADDSNTSNQYSFAFIMAPGNRNNFSNGACRLYMSIGTNPFPGYTEYDAYHDSSEILYYSWFGPYGRFYTPTGVLTFSDEAYKKEIKSVSKNDDNILDRLYEWSKTAIIKYKLDYNGDNIKNENGEINYIGDITDLEEELQNNIETQEEQDDSLKPKPGDWNYDYYMDHEEERVHYGVSAQKLFEILPETTCYDAHNNLRSVNYSELHNVMIAALIKQIEDLKERINQLENGNS